MEMIGTGVLTCAIQNTQDSKTSKKWCFIIQTTSIFFSSELSCFDEEVVAGTMSLVAGTMSLGRCRWSLGQCRWSLGQCRWSMELTYFLSFSLVGSLV
jgi:hypothetical protein